MLGRKDYTQEELTSCKVAIGAQLQAYKDVEAAVGEDALAGFEGPFFNHMVLALDRYFVHRVRAVSGKDGNPLNEVELIVDSLMLHGGVLQGSNVIKYVPGDSVLGPRDRRPHQPHAGAVRAPLGRLPGRDRAQVSLRALFRRNAH